MPRRLFKYGLAVVRDGRLLLCRPHAFPDLIMPGGLQEDDETPEAGIRREVREELGGVSQVRAGSLELLGRFEDAAAGRSNTIIEMEVWLGELDGEPSPSSEIRELVWFGGDDDPTKLSAIVRNHVWPALQAKGLV
jgi:ADP-ribose pyrophosphatase YjhB (NUDIX family)